LGEHFYTFNLVVNFRTFFRRLASARSALRRSDGPPRSTNNAFGLIPPQGNTSSRGGTRPCRQVPAGLGLLLALVAPVGAYGGRDHSRFSWVMDRCTPAARTHAPASFPITLDKTYRQAARQNRLLLRELLADGTRTEAIPAQFVAEREKAIQGEIWWIMPPGNTPRRRFVLEIGSPTPAPLMRVRYDRAALRMNIFEHDLPVLRYNYGTVSMPPAVRERFARGAYPSPPYDPKGLDRGDYIHPLYGPSGEELTEDYPIDHPHHRGIYWAWPEVYFQGKLRDIHAVYGVWARPSKVLRLIEGPVLAGIEVENIWKWQDEIPIVRERVLIRAFRRWKRQRYIDLEFQFTGLAPDVKIARRHRDAYGGLNFRMAAGEEQEIEFFTDPEDHPLRRAWADMRKIFSGSTDRTGVAILQHQSNPRYPGPWVQYPDINWYQPTFPATGEMYPLPEGETLTLKYRLWIRPAPRGSARAILNTVWQAYNDPPQPLEDGPAS